MATLTRFEDIEAWKRARELTRMIYHTTSRGAFCKDFALRDQIRRACISIMSNIAEGFERNSNNEMRHFFGIAKGSTGEVKSQLYIGLDAQYLTQEQFQQLVEITNHISRLLGGFIQYLKTKPPPKSAP